MKVNMLKQLVFLTVTLSIVNSQLFSQEVPITVDTQLVTVPVVVYDRSGRVVTGLGKDDFEILENGVKQSIANYVSEEVPITVMFLVDNSGSMRNELNLLVDVLNVGLASLRPEDTLIVASFDDNKKIKILVPPKKKQYFSNIVTFYPGTGLGYTTTFNAVDSGLKYLQQFEGKKALILFTDGELYGLGVSMQDNFRLAEEETSVIYTVRFGEYPTVQPGITVTDKIQAVLLARRYGNALGIPKKELEKFIKRVKSYLEGLSERTGGRSYDVLTLEDAKRAYREIVAELGYLINLSYYPIPEAKKGEKRSITVKVKVPNTAVRHRPWVVY